MPDMQQAPAMQQDQQGMIQERGYGFEQEPVEDFESLSILPSPSMEKAPSKELRLTPSYVNKEIERLNSIRNKAASSGANPQQLEYLRKMHEDRVNNMWKELDYQQKSEKEGKKEEFEMYKISQPERKEIVDAAKRSRANLQDLNRMEELQDEGKLDTPGYIEFLNRSGLDVPALMNKGSQEFNKIVQTFMRDARTYFGARVSNFELEQFLKGIPSLSQTPEGRKRVLSNLKRINRVALLYNDTYKDMLKENDWSLPLYWQEKLDDRISPKLDKITDQFKADLKKEVPKGQNRLITLLQAGAGSIIGAPGKILGKAGSLVSGGELPPV